jgi:hypothetical protein
MLRSLLAFVALLLISAKVSSWVRKSPRLSHDPETWWNADALGLLAFCGAVIVGGALIVLLDHY